MTKYIFPIVLLLIILFSSCDDAFETTLKVDPPPHNPQMVVHSFIKSTDDSIGISVGRSIGLLDDADGWRSLTLSDATVEIYQGGALKYTLLPLEDITNGEQYLPLNYGLILDEPIGNIGESFEIKVSHPDYPTVNATQVMPDSVSVTEAKFTEDGGIGEEGERLNSIDITFTDPAGIENYYEIAVAERYNNSIGYTIQTETNDPYTQEGSNRTHLLNDLAIDGQEYTLNLQLNSSYSDEMVIVFKSVTENWYLYSRSVQDYQNTGDFGPFAEPVTVHRNVEGGLGVFAAGSQVIQKVVE